MEMVSCELDVVKAEVGLLSWQNQHCLLEIQLQLSKSAGLVAEDCLGRIGSILLVSLQAS
jgi:hypothetical protein